MRMKMTEFTDDDNMTWQDQDALLCSNNPISQREKVLTTFYRVFNIITLISLGIFIGLFASTFTVFEEYFNISLHFFAWAFVTRGLGLFTGVYVTDLLHKRLFPYGLISFNLTFLGICVAFLVWVKSFWAFVLILFFIGYAISATFIGVGAGSSIYHPDLSKFLHQSFVILVAIGTFIGSLIMYTSILTHRQVSDAALSLVGQNFPTPFNNQSWPRANNETSYKISFTTSIVGSSRNASVLLLSNASKITVKSTTYKTSPTKYSTLQSTPLIVTMQKIQNTSESSKKPVLGNISKPELADGNELEHSRRTKPFIPPQTFTVPPKVHFTCVPWNNSHNPRTSFNMSDLIPVNKSDVRVRRSFECINDNINNSDPCTSVYKQCLSTDPCYFDEFLCLRDNSKNSNENKTANLTISRLRRSISLLPSVREAVLRPERNVSAYIALALLYATLGMIYGVVSFYFKAKLNFLRSKTSDTNVVSLCSIPVLVFVPLFGQLGLESIVSTILLAHLLKTVSYVQLTGFYCLYFCFSWISKCLAKLFQFQTTMLICVCVTFVLFFLPFLVTFIHVAVMCVWIVLISFSLSFQFPTKISDDTWMLSFAMADLVFPLFSSYILDYLNSRILFLVLLLLQLALIIFHHLFRSSLFILTKHDSSSGNEIPSSSDGIPSVSAE